MRWRCGFGYLGGAFLLMAGGALFAPPPAVPITPPPVDAQLLERLFPGVPAWWALARVVALVAGGGLVARALPTAAPRPPAISVPLEAPRPWGQALALGAAVMHLSASIGAASLGRALQVLYVIWWVVPPLALWVASPWRERRRDAWQGTVVAFGVAVGWALAYMPTVFGSRRAADPLDAWRGFAQLGQLAESRANLLTSPMLVGASPLYFVLQGAGVADADGTPVSFATLQVLAAAWLGLSGILSGWVADRLLGRAAVPVVVTGLLFSPFAMMVPLTPTALFLGAVFASGMLACVVAVHADRSPAALAAFGGLAGLAVTHPVTAPLAVVLAGVLGWSLRQGPRPPRTVTATAVVLLLSGVVLVLPTPTALRGMTQTYTRGRAQWTGQELAGFGQIPGPLSEYAVEAGRPGPLDAPLGAALAPLAIPRTPSRLLGDSLLDPVSAVLAVVGVGVCLRGLPANWTARLLVLALGATVVPAMVASADRISFVRLMAAPPVLALLGGVAFEAGRRALLPQRAPWLVAATTSVAVAVGGTALFVVVTPWALPSSATTIALEALDGSMPAGGALLLDHPRPGAFPALYLRELATALAPPRVEVVTYRDATSLGDGRRPEVIFWSPALEEQSAVAAAVCAQWPGTALLSLRDRLGFSRVFAARPAGHGWTPGLPAGRWDESGCGSELVTEGTQAAAALAAAADLWEGGRRSEAVAVLRSAARRSWAQPRLFETLAVRLLALPAAASDRREALHWAETAAAVTRGADAHVAATLAAARAAVDDVAGLPSPRAQ